MKIVILDDSFTVRLTLEAILEDLGVEEDELYSFEDGYKALEFIESNEVDIIFSDVNMPIMSGVEFVTKLISYNKELAQNLFIISGIEEIAGLREIKQAGAKRFLKKPFSVEIINHFLKYEIAKRKKYNS